MALGAIRLEGDLRPAYLGWKLASTFFFHLASAGQVKNSLPVASGPTVSMVLASLFSLCLRASH